MGKTGDLFKKIRDTKGKFHTKMGTIKHRKQKLLRIAGKNMQINYARKVFMTQLSTMV